MLLTSAVLIKMFEGGWQSVKVLVRDGSVMDMYMIHECVTPS